MKKIVLATSLMLGAALLTTPSMAVPASGPTAIPWSGSVQPVQYFYGGRNYCWYNNGWRGPGFYWCGYASRRGMGWGGGAGWRGWDHRGGQHFRGPPPHHGHGMYRGDRNPNWHGGGPRGRF